MKETTTGGRCGGQGGVSETTLLSRDWNDEKEPAVRRWEQVGWRACQAVGTVCARALRWEGPSSYTYGMERKQVRLNPSPQGR